MSTLLSMWLIYLIYQIYQLGKTGFCSLLCPNVTTGIRLWLEPKEKSEEPIKYYTLLETERGNLLCGNQGKATTLKHTLPKTHKHAKSVFWTDNLTYMQQLKIFFFYLCIIQHSITRVLILMFLLTRLPKSIVQCILLSDV